MPDYVLEPVLTAEAVSHDEAYERQRQGTRQLLLARGCFFASVSVVSFILARELGAANYGIYGVVISQLFWLEMLTNAGVPGATAKLIADGRHDLGEVEGSARALLLGLSIILLAVGWFLAPQVASFMRIPRGEVLFRIAIIDLPFAALYASYDGILYGHRRFGALAAAQVIYGMTKLAGVVVLTALGLSIERVLIATVFSTSVVCAVLAVRYRPRGLRPTSGIMRRIAAIAAPMGLYLVSGQVLVNLDLWSLKSLWQGGDEVVGQYVASVNLAKTLTVIPAVQAGVLFASVAWAVASRDAARARRHIQEASRFAVVIIAAACVILGLNASEVLSVLFSSAYAEGDRFLPLQLAGFGLFALLDAFSHSLMAAGRQWFVAGALVTTLPLAWFSNYLLIPRLGPLGAAISMLLGTAIGAALTGVMAYRHFGSLVRSSTLFRVLCAAALVGLVSAAIPVRGPLVFVKLALLGGLYLLVLHVLGEITGKDFGLPVKSPTDRSA
jgi:O-antigen/teichoic acid export membrane protein